MDLLASRREQRDDEDFYRLLGCDEASTEEQIATEFKLLARRHHPDKVIDAEEKLAAEKHFQKLEKARRVLLDKGMRAKYDEWRNSGFIQWLSFDDWLAMQSRVHSSIHWATPQQKRPSLPEPELKGDSPKENNSAQTGIKTESTPSSERNSKEELSYSKDASPLQEFRRGSEGTSLLNQFRNYHV